MVNIFIRAVGSHPLVVWRLLESVRTADTIMRLAELEYLSLKKIVFLFGQGPGLCSPLFL